MGIVKQRAVDSAISALAIVFDPARFAIICFGIILGLIIGVIPGIGGLAGMALLFLTGEVA